ncbi:MAG: hypothetical protein ACRBM6_24535 [Geminicoccales bacterium]
MTTFFSLMRAKTERSHQWFRELQTIKAIRAHAFRGPEAITLDDVDTLVV